MMFVVALLLVTSTAGVPINLGDLPMQNPDLFEGDIIGVDGNLNDKNAISDPSLKWPDAKVPYVIDQSLSSVVSIIEKAIADYHSKTCVKFVKRTTESDFIRMYSGQGCYSYVGKAGGSQAVSLGNGCHHVGTIVHELGHAIGFHHEQNRSDRDDHLIIFWENIQKGMESQFQKLLPSQNILYNSFDTDSVMLYGETAFSKDGKLATMKAKNGKRLSETYEKAGLSPADVERVNKLYEC